jgi:hypothetical protein
VVACTRNFETPSDRDRDGSDRRQSGSFDYASQVTPQESTDGCFVAIRQSLRRFSIKP